MTVAILGVGVMGEALLAGILQGGRPVSQVLAAEKRPERVAELTERYGVEVVDNAEAVERADTVLLVVKPYDVGPLLDEVAASARSGQLFVSLAAGITTSFVEERLPDGVAVVRVMPNTPALIGEGMAAMSPGSRCEESHLAEAEDLLRSTGRVTRVPEKHQDAVTAISGSGPAYVFYVVEAMIEAGVHLGLPRPTATELVVQTLAGSAALLRERVTSPGGTTAAALRRLDDGGVRAAFLGALEAARDRSRALSSGEPV